MNCFASRRLGSGLAAAFLGVLLVVPAALAAYPPGPFPGPAPAGLFPRVLTSQTVCAEGGSLAASQGATDIRLDVPANAFGDCTQVTIYGADKALAKPLVPDGYALIEALAVGWSATGVSASSLSLSVGQAASGHSAIVGQLVSGLVLTVRSTAINSKTLAFRTTGGGIQNDDGLVVSAGEVTVTVNDPVGIVIVGPGIPNTSTSGDTLDTPALDPSASGPGLLAIAFGLLGLLGAFMLLVRGWRRQRRS